LQKTSDEFVGCFTLLKRWREGLDTFVQFSDMTGFRGEKSARESFMDNLDEAVSGPAWGMWLKTQTNVADWHRELGFSIEEFSSDLARVFVHLGVMGGVMSQPKLEVKLARFNEVLFAWYQL
jgi:hypothetical protein